MFLGQLSETLPAGVDPSVILESLDSLKSDANWPEIVHAMSLAVKVRIPAFRGIPCADVCVCADTQNFARTGDMGRLLPMPWRGPPGRCLYSRPHPSGGRTVLTALRAQISMFTRKITVDDGAVAVAPREQEKAPGGAAAPLETV